MRLEKNIEALARPEYLFRLLANLVRNAASYAGHAGPIVASAANGGNTVSIVVADEAPECRNPRSKRSSNRFTAPNSPGSGRPVGLGWD